MRYSNVHVGAMEMSGNEHETGDPFLPKPDAGGFRGTVPPMRHTRIKGNTMDIGNALDAMRRGDKVARAGWNGKNMYLLHAEGGTFSQEGMVMGDLIQFIVMKTADDKFVPWLASQTDLLATDWEIVA